MIALTFVLTADQPLLLTALQGDPNSSVSFPYIPGSVIRGTIIGHYIQRHCPRKELDPAAEDIQRLFFNARTRYLNAYPAVDLPTSTSTPQRLLPLPRLWRTSADTPLTAQEWLCLDRTAAPTPTKTTVLAEQPGILGAFGWLHQGSLAYREVLAHSNIHNQRDRAAGRGTGEQGAVFRYQAIAAGQRFQSVIVLDDATAAADGEMLANLLRATPHTHIGGSQSAGYGRVCITDVQRVDSWHEVGSAVPTRMRCDASHMHLTLLSDMIVRDDATGQADATCAVAALACHPDLAPGDLVLEPVQSVMATTLHGGFNRTWGLPLPQTQALAAGSVLVFRVAGTLDPNRVAALEACGLGERRAEGFGRLAINWPPEAAPLIVSRIQPPAESAASPEAAPTTAGPALPQPLSPSTVLARQMAQRMLDQRLEEHLVSLLETHHINRPSPDKGISRTQLARLWLIARRVLLRLEEAQSHDTAAIATAMQPLTDLLDTLPQNARQQFEATRMQTGERLMAWLRARLDTVRALWGDPPQLPTVTLVGVTVTVDDRLAAMINVRLIMAVARHARRVQAAAGQEEHS